MKTFTIGDIHGNLKALKQCLERSGFDKENDRLIQLGDIADGWHEVYDCIEELKTIKTLILIKGNHDDWFIQWLQTGNHPDGWRQGGEGTLKSYVNKLGYSADQKLSGWTTAMTPFDIPESHKDFWYKQIPYFRDEDNNIFIHGGFSRHFMLDEQLPYTFWWDRDLFYAALSTGKDDPKSRALKFKDTTINNVFIGHTATTYWKTNKPIFADRVINIDTGAGWKDKLTIMNVDTKKYWQSDMAEKLYPGLNGRK